ncbi:hypothetical protein VC83_09382 [Pseudogymnoascus destructans]|uniref:Uncharacterized protein n=1 Tax=Pseudogymnoascus destructans TaxID=655981 RepID=A0A176ZWZ8_9PEZI|nr:uncharacterized protein VC83_09382 [Pseudogymnoascus destructans]OAF54307.2 hypothetical protein VC83_09382 [Pseudogymnoascus destructans]
MFPASAMVDVLEKGVKRGLQRGVKRGLQTGSVSSANHNQVRVASPAPEPRVVSPLRSRPRPSTPHCTTAHTEQKGAHR